MGFRYSLIKRNPFLYEREDLTQWRAKYIREIDEYRRKGYLLVYLDETWVFAGMSHSKDWLDPIVESNPFDARKKYKTIGPTPLQNRGNRAIVIGAICQDGIIPGSIDIIISGKSTDDGDYHREMNAQIFEDWLQRNIPNFRGMALDRPIVVILDNAPYHGRYRYRIPRSKTAKKQELIEFLEEQELEFPIVGTKAIYDGIIEEFLSRNPHITDEKEVESICRENGVSLLRLPPYHCMFNPIETLWGHMKRLVREQATPEMKLPSIREISFKILDRVQPELIKKFFVHAEHAEEDFCTKEGLLRCPIACPFIIPLEEEMDEDSESDEDVDVIGDWE